MVRLGKPHSELIFPLRVQIPRNTATVGNGTDVFMCGVQRTSPNVFLMAESLTWWECVCVCVAC